MADTAGKPIECRAAVVWKQGDPLVVETVTVAPPREHEVRIQMHSTGFCHTDATALAGIGPWNKFPIILGHEGSGVVESVGPGVTRVKPGDHVIPMWLAQCDDCKPCTKTPSNLCAKSSMLTYVFDDGTTPFTCKGETIYHFMNCSTFSQYTVVREINVVKINPEAPLEKVCLLGCGIPTGYGAAVNTAAVKPGSTCAVWGLGGVGLGAVMGCKNAGATRIIGIDINADKFPAALEFGATECLNPTDHEKPLPEVLKEMTGGGLDCAIECIGNVQCMETALSSTHEGWGVTTLIGVTPAGKPVATNPYLMLFGRTLNGSLFGGFKARDSLPKLVDDYLAKKIKVDEFITHRMPLEDINKALELMREGKSLRSVIKL